MNAIRPPRHKDEAEFAAEWSEQQRRVRNAAHGDKGREKRRLAFLVAEELRRETAS